MDLNTEKQIIDQLSKASKILVALPMHLNPDALASALALAGFLKRLEKDVEIVTSGKIDENLKFLPGVENVNAQVKASKSLVLQVDTSARKLSELSYQVEPDKVSIFLKADKGTFVQQDVNFSTDKFPVNAIVTLDVKSLEDLGPLFEQNAELFYETPKINIDNKPSNEYFGAINLVDITASSIAEILTSLFERFENQMLDESMATCLLAGIISKTQSFQHQQTTPKAFLAASQLIAAGAKQQDIVKNIFKTKSLPLLKLWGRALAKLQTAENLNLAYSILSRSDFQKAEAGAELLEQTVRELKESLADYKIVALLAEAQDGRVKVAALLHSLLNIRSILEQFSGGPKVTELVPGPFVMLQSDLDKLTLVEAESLLLKIARELLSA